MSDTFQIESPTHHVTTFRERGVAVPFTTPLLLGARARAAARGVELLLPNLSGKRGVYVLPWSGVQQICRPSVHDTLLRERLDVLGSLTPRKLRQISRELAAAGYAGPEAKAAVRRADESDLAMHQAANRHLLLALMRQFRPTGALDTDLEQQGRALIVELAPKFRSDPEALTFALEEMGTFFASFGVEAADRSARIPTLLDQLRELHQSLAAWMPSGPDDIAAGIAQATAEVVAVAIDHGQAILTATRALTNDITALIRKYLADPDVTQELIERPDWVLDGWEIVAGLWSVGGQSTSRKSRLLEIAQILPHFPREIEAWHQKRRLAPSLEPALRVVSINEGWRTGKGSVVLTERNEALRAQCL